MIERVVIEVRIYVGRVHDGFTMEVATTYCESTLTGGKRECQVDRYDQMSLDELEQMLLDVSERPLPGEPLEHRNQLSMFTLS